VFTGLRTRLLASAEKASFNLLIVVFPCRHIVTSGFRALLLIEVDAALETTSTGRRRHGEFL
jgi:hypothetical protein